VKSFSEKLNTPVQGKGADGLKLALALLWERREHLRRLYLWRTRATEAGSRDLQGRAQADDSPL